MKFLILNGSPKKDGLCISVMNEIIKGAADGGADVETYTPQSIGTCKMCGGGWGTCRADHKCSYRNDGFDAGQEAVKNADAVCIITPVYWCEMSEQLKMFLDRLRRCEFGLFTKEGALAGKQVLLVASPGGSGNGAVECIDQMDRFCRHMAAVIFDYISVNRWNSDYKKQAAYSAAYALAKGRKAGDTV
jgi:multimeric flavodoxin WrbA